MSPEFKHPEAVLRFWRSLIRPLTGGHPTPFFLFSVRPIEKALAELDRHLGHLPVRHWLSCKTQPLPPLLRWWRTHGRPIEVVSEFELLAALQEGFPPGRILVNGPAKHHWLRRHPVRGLNVTFDSAAEARALAASARKLGWTTGLRLHTPGEHDPQAPQHPTQFGMTGEEVFAALRALERARVTPEIIHFHLRSNVASGAVYARALAEAAELCRQTGFAPNYIDCGGGFPPPHVLGRGGRSVDGAFQLADMALIYEQALAMFPSAREIWLENGRWLTARSGVLVTRILEVKERRGMRNLICDGGRTTHALLSIWENHGLVSLPARSGPTSLTTVNGPTCMAFDQLARRPLSRSLRAADHLVWLDAGAYHLPWETRFSHGLSAVLWHEGGKVRVARRREDFRAWWGQWEDGQKPARPSPEPVTPATRYPGGELLRGV